MARVPTHGFPVGVSGYEPLGLLGQGASGQVFKARQRSTGQFVAIKVPSTGTALDPAARRRVHQRLHQETRILALVQHAHVVRLIDKGMATGGMLYAVLEFIPGTTLREHLRAVGPMSLLDTMAVMAQLLDALAFLHVHHIVHRDLKPENVMIATNGAALHAKMLDFGLASHHGVPHFVTGADGTPAYCAPEQLRGELCVGATDIYAWALIFVECLNARPCLTGATPADIVHRQLSASAIELPEQLQNHPLAHLLRQCLQKDVRLRTADAAALYAALMRSLEGGRTGQAIAPTRARPSGEGPPEAYRQITLDAVPIARESGTAEMTLVVLCLSLSLIPTRHASLSLVDLQDMREQNMLWCRNVVQAATGHCVGTLGERQLFHFEKSPSAAHNVLQATTLAYDLCSRVQRKSRMLEIQHGARLEVAGGMHVTVLQSLHSVSGTHHANNVALHLHSLAQSGVIVLSLAMRNRLADGAMAQEFHGPSTTHEPEMLYQLVAPPN